MGALDLIAMAAKAGKKSAPFFSKADVLLDELQRGKGTGDEFLTELVKKGAKPTELRERGIEGALKGKPKMSKAEVKQVFEEKAPPKIKEEIRGGDEYKEALDEKAREIIGDEYATFDDLYGRDREYAKFSVEKDFGYTPETKHEEWRTPGGENYREILLKLPQRGLNDAEKRILMNYEADVRRGVQLDPWHQSQYDALKVKEAMGNQDYMGPHWKGTPNVLAHIRVQDFKTPEGKKVLLVDEIQSDWHQEGRKKGYRGQESKKISDEEYKRGVALQQRSVRGEPMTQEEVAEMNDILQRHAQSIPGMRVPDAPFKKNWHELAMKRVLDYAAENGYDTVAITPGAEQAKRYDLSKHVDAIIWERDANGKITYTPEKEGMALTGPRTVSQNELADHLGKDVAEKILRDEETSGALGGIDLQVGGEGMKGFYDKILPDYLNTYGKQYGSGVGKISLKTPSAEPWNIEDAARFHGMTGPEYLDSPNRSLLEKQFLESRENKTAGFHSFDITPQMREQIKTKGQPLYSKIGVPGAEAAAATGAATIGAEATQNNTEQPVQNPVHFTENPDAMLLELMQRN